MVFQLTDELTFPDPRYGEPDGLLAVGGDLSVDRLLLAYSNGIFPWYSFRDNEEILWFCPMKRFVIFPEEIHVSHSMHTLLLKDSYEYSFNMAFDDVIRLCSEVDGRRQQRGAWLGDDMIKAYTHLHQLRFAASVEVWDEGRLVGGLYGVNDIKRAHSANMTLDAVAADRAGKKRRAVAKSVFLPLRSMSKKYPYLRKLPFLLPVAWVQRVIGYISEQKSSGAAGLSKTIRIGRKRIDLLREYDIIR